MANQRIFIVAPHHPTKGLIVLLMSMLVGAGLSACGGTRLRATSTAPSTSTSAPTRSVSTLSTSGATAAQHLLGDYDNDDTGVGPNDSDDDENYKPTDGDGDLDNKSGSHYDSDDKDVRDFGRSASSNDRRSIEALLRNYYTAALRGEGMEACSLIYQPLAKTFPRDLGIAGPKYLHGAKTCSEVISKLLTQFHRQLTSYASTLKVTDARLGYGIGLVILGFGNLRRLIEVRRERGTWKIYDLIDTELS